MIVNDLQIRRMCMADIPSVAALEKRSFTTPWSVDELEQTLKNDITVFWVAVVNGELAGYISRTHSFETMDILTVCVSEKYRRKGVATSLLSFLENDAKEKGVEKIFLEVRESNTGARTMYEKNGYLLLNKRKRYYSDPVEDALILQKEINK